MKVIEYRFKREWDSQQFDTVNEFYMEVEVNGELFYCKKRFHKQIPFEYARREAEHLMMQEIKKRLFG
jgi:hypothetical protein